MSRKFVVSSAQMGPVFIQDTRIQCVKRMMEMMREAKAKGSRFVVYPELALTTFFPRWFIENPNELDKWFETEMPSKITYPLFELAKNLEIGFYLGYAEKTNDNGKVKYYNTSILVNKSGEISGKYRKIHLPGHEKPQYNRKNQHLEKMYFEKGNLGFPIHQMLNTKIGMLICNDRRWTEAWRILALQSAELICLGYNTPNDHTGYSEIDNFADFHHLLSMQGGSYLNSVWSIATAKCGYEEGSSLIGNSVITSPAGQIIVQSETLEDEVINAEIDLDMVLQYRKTFFDFSRHREPENYKIIFTKKGHS